jgi:hypothetical protein
MSAQTGVQGVSLPTGESDGRAAIDNCGGVGRKLVPSAGPRHGLSSVEGSASPRLLEYCSAQVRDGYDLDLTNAEARSLLDVIDAARVIAAMKAPSIARLLLARDYGYEASKVSQLVDAVEKLERGS